MNESPQPPSLPSTPSAPRTPGIAIASLVLGILSFLCFGPLTGIPGIICGHVARKRINASGGTLGGSGIGLAGLILGYVNLALSIIVIPMMLAIAIPNFVKARTTAQQNVCIAHLKMLDLAKEQWGLENKKELTDTPTMGELVGPSLYIKTTPVCPAGGSYTIGSLNELPTCSFAGHQLPE